MERRRVLVIEENRRRIGALHDKLERSGYETEVAVSGEMALTIVHTRDMDAAVLDHTMSGYNEWELVRELKNRAPELPIVLINGPRQKGISRAARRAGATRFMRSPVNLGRVVAAVGGVIEE